MVYHPSTPFPEPDMTDFLSPPKPRKKAWKKWVFISLALLLIAITGGILVMQAKFANFQPPMPPPGVVVSAAAQVDFSDKIEAVGTAQADESAMVMAKVTETVKSINFEEGAPVTQGTVLVQLNDDEERALLDEASKSYDRYAALAKTKIGSRARAESEFSRMEVAKAQVADRQIVAPFDGIAGIRRISVGDMVSPTTLITTIDDIDPIKLEFSISENALSSLKSGLSIEARTDAYRGEIFNGSIIAIDPRVNADTRSITVKAKIENPDGRLRPGLLMTVNLYKNRREALAVPEESIIATGTKKTVMVVGSDNIAHVRDVETGERYAGGIEILSGLTAGDKVIVEGQIKAQDGKEVKIVEEKTLSATISGAMEYAVPRKQEALESSGAVPPAPPEAEQPQQAPEQTP